MYTLLMRLKFMKTMLSTKCDKDNQSEGSEMEKDTMDISEKDKCALRERLDQAEQKMERLRRELAEITAVIKKDPNRELGYDKEAWDKNMELSAAIQDFLIAEREYNGDKSEYYCLWK